MRSLGPALLLVASCTAVVGIVASGIERLFQRLRLHDVGTGPRAVVERKDIWADGQAWWLGNLDSEELSAFVCKALISLNRDCSSSFAWTALRTRMWRVGQLLMGSFKPHPAESSK